MKPDEVTAADVARLSTEVNSVHDHLNDLSKFKRVDHARFGRIKVFHSIPLFFRKNAEKEHDTDKVHKIVYKKVHVGNKISPALSCTF